jgi:hypothetical protein
MPLGIFKNRPAAGQERGAVAEHRLGKASHVGDQCTRAPSVNRSNGAIFVRVVALPNK